MPLVSGCHTQGSSVGRLALPTSPRAPSDRHEVNLRVSFERFVPCVRCVIHNDTEISLQLVYWVLKITSHLSNFWRPCLWEYWPPHFHITARLQHSSASCGVLLGPGSLWPEFPNFSRTCVMILRITVTECRVLRWDMKPIIFLATTPASNSTRLLMIAASNQALPILSSAFYPLIHETFE